MKNRRNPGIEGKVDAFLSKVGMAAPTESLLKFVDQLRTTYYTDALREVRRRFESIPVDYTRCKPVVKITGEFWAQTTEGDGNFNMFQFLEREGAQVLVEPIATWVAYLLYQAKAHAKAKWPVNRPHRNPQWWEFKKHLANDLGLRKKVMAIKRITPLTMQISATFDTGQSNPI